MMANYSITMPKLLETVLKDLLHSIYLIYLTNLILHLNNSIYQFNLFKFFYEDLRTMFPNLSCAIRLHSN